MRSLSEAGCELLRRPVPEAAMGTAIIVVVQPLLDLLGTVLEVQEPMLVEALLPKSAIE